MKKMITLTIDDVEVKVEESSTVLDAAKSVGIYIPALCAHPNLPPAIGMKPGNAIYRGNELVRNSFPKEFEGCKLCVVEIEGAQTTSLACNTFVTEGMVVHTNTPRLKELRRDNLAQILANHPHACLTCAEREGCSREPCSLNVPVNERCCPKLGRCELQKVAEYIGIKPELTRYQSRGLPSLKDEPLFERDYNLCIGCLRCVRVCKDIRGVGALDFVWNGSEFVVGTISSASLKDSDCKFCGACVEVCPTGALTDKKIMMLAEREKELVPCSNACPAGIDVPRYVRLIKKEKFAEAYNVIREKVPFPSVLGRVCHRPCESECRRSELNEPIAVRELKRFVTEQAEGAKVIKKRAPTGKKVAVVGSGPAGLTASYYLAEKGYDVTVFESLPVAGGALAVCIPEYRLPKEILDIDIQNIRNAGVKIKTNVTVGNDVLFDDILKEYKAVFIATGAHKSLKLDIPNENADGVLYAMEFLKDANLKKKIKIGKRVGVIGGGNA
ncbi:MAG: FAD-dependent oxidoreductase, partial [Candidatus Thermoplasmatota archaeon]|nr:FAD-dependent oxidoreductase [Candidatus Thermoplasmatota archaeon]